MSVLIEWFHVSEKEPPKETRILIASNSMVYTGLYHGKSHETDEMVFSDTVRHHVWNVNYWALLPPAPNFHFESTSDVTGSGDSELDSAISSIVPNGV